MDVDGSLRREAIAALHSNGATSASTIERAHHLDPGGSLRTRVDLGWNSSAIVVDEPGGESILRSFTATPTTIAMNRVMAVDAAIDRFAQRRSTEAEALAEVRSASALRPIGVLPFAAACAAGASGLAVVFGIQNGWTVLLIAASAAAGAVLRRLVGILGGNNFWQVGFAALLAGLLGAIATEADISSSLRLAAVCPCLILVPGPHLLNGALDLASLRIPLGLSRLVFAALTLLVIGAGLLTGLALGGAELDLDPAPRQVPLRLDAASAGLVAVCYALFYSAPLRTLGWPLVIGAVVHAVHWVSIERWHLEPSLAAGLACLGAAALLVPASRRFRVPFSAIGFASVVSLMPGVLILRVFAGLASLPTAPADGIQRILILTIDDAYSACATIAAMTIGLLLPAVVYGWSDRRRSSSPGSAS